MFSVWFVIVITCIKLKPGGLTPYKDLYREIKDEMGTFFRFLLRHIKVRDFTS